MKYLKLYESIHISLLLNDIYECIKDYYDLKRCDYNSMSSIEIALNQYYITSGFADSNNLYMFLRIYNTEDKILDNISEYITNIFLKYKIEYIEKPSYKQFKTGNIAFIILYGDLNLVFLVLILLSQI